MNNLIKIGWCFVFLSVVICACHTVTVIPADKEVRWLAPGGTYTATNGVWIVPDARFQQILRKLNQP